MPTPPPTILSSNQFINQTNTFLQITIFDNQILVLITQEKAKRIGIWIEARFSSTATATTIKNNRNIEIQTLMGNQNDIYCQLIARVVSEIVNRNVLVGIALQPEFFGNEIHMMNITTFVKNFLTSSI
jgi:hypothetical protein